MNSIRVTSKATEVWNVLNGIINVYKPAGVKVNHVRGAIITHLCSGKYQNKS